MFAEELACWCTQILLQRKYVVVYTGESDTILILRIEILTADIGGAGKGASRCYYHTCATFDRQDFTYHLSK